MEQNLHDAAHKWHTKIREIFRQQAELSELEKELIAAVGRHPKQRESLQFPVAGNLTVFLMEVNGKWHPTWG